MTLGSTPRQADIFRSTTEFCEPRVRPDSIYALLHRECFALFPDALFGDLFTDIGRRSIPAGQVDPEARARPEPDRETRSRGHGVHTAVVEADS